MASKNNTLETLPEDYPQFSFSKDYGKYKANPGFGDGQQEGSEADKSNSVSSVIQRNPVVARNSTINKGVFGTVNNSIQNSINGAGGILRSNPPKLMSPVNQNTLDKYNSSKFDNLQSILDTGTNQGTVIHQSFGSDVVGDGTTKFQPEDNEYDKENVPVWMKKLREHKAKQDMENNNNTNKENLELGYGDDSFISPMIKDDDHSQLVAEKQQTYMRSSSDGSSSSKLNSGASNYDGNITPDSSVNRSPQHFPEKSIRPITQSTAISTYNSRPAMDSHLAGSSNSGSLQSGQQSPLKLFSSDNYNTYTKEKMDNLINSHFIPEQTVDSSENSKRGELNFDQNEYDDSMRILKNQNSSYGTGSRFAFKKMPSINEIPSHQTSINEDEHVKSRSTHHSRGSSKGSQSIIDTLSSSHPKQAGDITSPNHFMDYADDVFSKFINHGPGVASKESLNVNSNHNNSNVASDTASYTSDDTSFNNNIANMDIRENNKNYNHLMNSQSIKVGQGILNHPHNARSSELFNSSIIQNVTNNMSTFDTIKFKGNPSFMNGDKYYSNQQAGIDKPRNYGAQNDYGNEQEEEDEMDETNDGIDSTQNISATFIQPKVKSHSQIISSHGYKSYFPNESYDQQLDQTGLVDGKHPGDFDYDINASFIKELRGTHKPSFMNEGRSDTKKSPTKPADKNALPKKLLKFAPGDIEIPQVHGMFLDKSLNKWVKRKTSEYSESSEEQVSTDLSRDDENVNALNAIADLSTASHNQISNDSSYEFGHRNGRQEGMTSYSDTTTNNNTLANNDITFNQLPNVSSVSQIADTTFSTSKRMLVSALMDVLSKNKNWELVRNVDLSNKSLSSLVECDTLLANLRIINVDYNYLRTLDDLPERIDNISAKGNKLGGLLSLKRYQDLEIVDFSGNFFKSLLQFKNLIHLRYLNLSGNLINNINALNNSGFQNLLTLDLSNNYIRGSINLKRFRILENLQELDLSNNFIENIDGVKYLPTLIILKADNNLITDFNFDGFESPEEYHKSLKKLSLKNNKLEMLNVLHFKNLRVLRVNDAIELQNLQKLHKLDELLINGSYDSNAKQCSEMNYQILRDVVEYNTIKTLNVSNTRINSLKISKYIALESMFCVFNEIENFQVLVEDIKFLSNLKRIDLRYNPITISFYFAGNKRELLNAYYDKEISKQDESMEEYDLEVSTIEEDNLCLIEGCRSQDIFKGKLQKQWEVQDQKFAEALKINNRNVYKKRIYYQGLMLSLFRKLKYLDGLNITKERRREILDEFKKL
ncbi:Nud1 protein [Saccharomycopsis crataegensis]|uniref:Nud1 protein n=1 Tax=Saccharomycopsis crataegensis TaxID=43959 RepID=A0AAV5QUZ3_9ASCO|nr:Nud1 protein [Saccharomycopsis crataegensis]